MIECIKIEDFVINQMFRPYMPSICPSDYQKKVESKLHSFPKYIIDILTENTKHKKGKVFKKTNIGSSDKEKNSLINKIKLGGEKCLTAIQLKIKKKKTNS